VSTLAIAKITEKHIVWRTTHTYAFHSIPRNVPSIYHVVKRSPNARALFFIYFVKPKGETTMSIPNYLMALANHQGPATIDAGGLSIPVKIMDINHEYNPRAGVDVCEFKCLVVNQDQIKPTALHVGEFVHQCAKEFLNQQYGRQDVKNTIAGAKALREAMQKRVDPMKIDRVIFNNPATIVFWTDGTKTVVKCQEGDVYSKETGLALCIAKKALGNKGNFNDVFHEWIPEEKEVKEVVKIHIPDVNTSVSDAMTEAINRMNEAANAAARALRGMAHE
jgi:hypothetical protein